MRASSFGWRVIDPVTAHKPLQRLRVLVVDDSRFARRIVKLLLESSEGFDVVGEATDGVDGLVKARDLQPDVITLDVDMPRLDGLRMLRLLRMESEVPVVLVTGLPHLMGELEHAAADLGSVEFVVKTFSDNPLDLSVFGEELAAKLRAAVLRNRSIC